MSKLFLCLFSFLFVASSLSAQWQTTPGNEGNVLCNASTEEEYSFSVSDGANGIINVFNSFTLSETNYKFYAQRISSNGQVLWNTSATPKPVCVTNSLKNIEYVLADGAGGVYISWVDQRTNPRHDIYMQHLNSSGNPMWAANGIKVSGNNSLRNEGAKLCSDGNGGVIISWTQADTNIVTNMTTSAQVLAQRINAAGNLLWAANGVQLCTAPGLRAYVSMVSDNAGGAIICFNDSRNSNHYPGDLFDNLDIYAQHINGSGALLWGANAVPVNTSANNQLMSRYFLQIQTSVTDGSGGCILFFNDFVDGNTEPAFIKAQRINSNGSLQWPASGVIISSDENNKYLLKAEPASGGAVVAWHSASTDAETVYHIKTQKVNAAGNVLWTADGVQVDDNIDNKMYNDGNSKLDMCLDASGNAIFYWVTDEFNPKIVAQKINASGAKEWTNKGVDIATYPYAYPEADELLQTADAGVFLVWSDRRNSSTTGSDKYVTRIKPDGTLGASASSYYTITNGNWNNPTTWSGGIVPPATANVTVRHIVTVTATASCNRVQLESTGRITVNSGISFTVLQ